MQLTQFINNINLYYISLVLTILIASLLFLVPRIKHGITIEFYLIVFTTISWYGFYLFNDILNSIFSLSYLSIKTYLILLIIGNVITIVTLNYKLDITYKIINYLLFTSNILIFITNILLLINSRLNIFSNIDTNIIIKVIDINIIIFLLYIEIIFLTYITKPFINKIKEKIKSKKLEDEQGDYESFQPATQVVEPSIPEPIYAYHPPKENISYNTSTPKEFDPRDLFYINGVDCSAIFYESDKDTILKNYSILKKDINAKLTNGCTLVEYTKILNIINKLGIKDVNSISLDLNQLSKINVDEYNLLKKYLKNKETIS